MTWLDIGNVAAIPRRGARVLRTAGGPIAVFRTSDDRVFALRDRCPHRGGPLSQGIVHGECVTCPLHDWVVVLPTGRARAPDEGDVETFAVRIEGEHVLIDVPGALPRAETPLGEAGGKVASEARSHPAAIASKAPSHNAAIAGEACSHNAAIASEARFHDAT